MSKKNLKMPKQQIEKCPVCKGRGSLPKAGKTIESRQRRRSDIANKLRGEGYTIREIMSLMGYKSPNSVAILLEKAK